MDTQASYAKIVADRVQRFALSREMFQTMMELDDNYSKEELYDCRLAHIRMLYDEERYDVMCLMYLGRNIDYTGFNREAVDDFCFYTNHMFYQDPAPEYLAGKIKFSYWLRLAWEYIREYMDDLEIVKPRTPLQELNLPTNAVHALKRADFTTVEDLLRLEDRKSLVRIRNIGPQSADAIVAALKKAGYQMSNLE